MWPSLSGFSGHVMFSGSSRLWTQLCFLPFCGRIMLHYMSISGLFIRSSVNDIRVLSSFQAIVNNARYKCFCGCVFLSVGRCLSMGWLGCMVTQCDPVSICQPVFQGGYTNPCFSTDPLICSMVPAILVGERCCLLVVLVCIS